MAGLSEVERRILDVLPSGRRRKMFLHLLAHPEYDTSPDVWRVTFSFWSNAGVRVDVQTKPEDIR